MLGQTMKRNTPGIGIAVGFLLFSPFARWPESLLNAASDSEESSGYVATEGVEGRWKVRGGGGQESSAGLNPFDFRYPNRKPSLDRGSQDLDLSAKVALTLLGDPGRVWWREAITLRRRWLGSMPKVVAPLEQRQSHVHVSS